MIIKNKKILITGGTGFIGKFLVKELQNKNNKIFIITRKKRFFKNNKELIYIKCDLLKISQKEATLLKKEIGDIDFSFYLAAKLPSISQNNSIKSYIEENLIPFMNFLDYFNTSIKKIVFSSTIDIYGYPKEINYDENTNPNPLTPYALAKLMCELYLEYYCKVNKKEFSIVRFSQVYGPNEPLLRVIPFILNAIIKEKPFTLIGRGLDQRKFLYVKDAVKGLINAALFGQNDVYHIAGREINTVMDVIRIAEKIFKRKLKINKKNINQPIKNTVPSIKKAENVLKYKPKYNLEQGLSEIKEYLSYETSR